MPKFDSDDRFRRELRRRIDRYFAASERRPRDCPQMYLKTAVVISLLMASYVLLVFFTATWWLAIPLAVLLGLALAAVASMFSTTGGIAPIPSTRGSTTSRR